MESIHPDLLLAFVIVADAGSFTGAARVLGLRQSTVSQQIKRLEAIAGRRLIARDTHKVALTVEGEGFIEHARRVLDAHAALQRYCLGVTLRGRLRFGASEDFVLSALPDVLAGFARRHPEVDLAVTAGLSYNLYQAFDAGDLDVILVKRRQGDRRGTTAWRERVAWVSRAEHRLEEGAPLPLLLYPPPSVTRALAIETLEEAQCPWRVAFTSASLSGLVAAARAGVGVLPHSLRLLPAGLFPIQAERRLPQLPEIEFVVIGPGGHQPVSDALMSLIIQWAKLA